MSLTSTHPQNVSIKSQNTDTLSDLVHNVDMFYAEFYEQMEEARELDGVILMTRFYGKYPDLTQKGHRRWPF